jgi:hypothetical protein
LIIDRHDVPVIQNRFYPRAESARAAPVGRLAIAMCTECGFVFNCAFDHDRVAYDNNYENDQGHSSTFRAHMSEMAERALAHAHGGSARVVEIGCGQGAFLADLGQRANGQLQLVGYDPAWRGGATPPNLRIERRFFDGTVLGGNAVPDVVVVRHVIEHVPDPIDFLARIRARLPNTWRGRLLVETPDLQWIADGGVVFDFFYEHCNYFSSATMRYTLARAGFRTQAIEKVFRGQHLWIEAVLASTPSDVPRPEVRPQAALNARERSYAGMWRDRLHELRARGGIAVWGAGAKGVTFANLVDRNADLIDCVIDVNPAKQALFIPVSGHLVLCPAAALARGVATIIVMNPNYRSEIEAELHRRGATALVLDA